MSDYSTAIDNKESKENYKVRVEGYFEDGRRKGFCTVTTNDIEVKGWYNKKGVLEGFGTVRYLPNGKYKFSVIVTCSRVIAIFKSKNICNPSLIVLGSGHKNFGRNVLIEGQFRNSMLEGIARVYGQNNLSSMQSNIEPENYFMSSKVNKI